MPRKLKTQDSKPYESIRGMWEGAYVSQFLRLFRCKFDFTSVNTQELEDALVDCECLLVADVCARLLRYLTDTNDIQIANFEGYLKHLVIEKCFDSNPLKEASTTWSILSAEEKLLLIKWLIDYVYKEKEEDLMEYLDENCSPDDMRGICAGQDAFNNLYWYLDDLRLYRENSVKKPYRKDWECVCLTLTDWHTFLKQFRKTTNIHERELYSYLNDELFPLIENQLKRLNDRNHKNNDWENKILLKKEHDYLQKMIMENKDKSELSSATVKSEPKVDSGLYPEKGDVLNGQTNTKIKCENEDSSSGIIADKKLDVATTNAGNITANTALGINAKTVASTASDVNMPQISMPACTATGGHQSGEIPCDVNSSLEDISNMGEEQNVVIKEENMGSMPIAIKEEKNMSIMGMQMPQQVGLGPCGPIQQPLQANMIHKQPSTMEAQYMQQQSQIFVFSTQLANQAAEALIQGHFPTIIAYHCAQPGTKRFLEKHPLKIQQFSRQNPAMWLNSLAQMKQNRGGPNVMKAGMMPNSMYGGESLGPNASQNSSWLMNHMTGQHPGMGSMGGNMPNDPGTWPGQPQNNPMYNPINSPMGVPLNSPIEQTNSLGNPAIGSPNMPSPMGGNGPSQQQYSMGMGQNQHPGIGSGQPQYAMMQQQSGGPQPNSHGMNVLSPSNQTPGMPQPTLTGVKVPDENLTPQQRQHREEQLAIIRNMHQMLFPDLHQGSPSGDCGNMGPGTGMMNNPQQGMMQGQGGPMGQHMQQHIGNLMMQHGQQNMMMGPGNGVNTGPRGHLQPNMFPNHPSMSMMSGAGSGGDGSHGFCTNNPMGPSQQHPGQRMMISQQTSMTPASMAAQMEWQKLQQQFYEERRVRHPGRPVGGMQMGNFPGTGGPMQGPVMPGGNSGQMGPGPGGGGGGGSGGPGGNGPSTPLGGPLSQSLPTSGPGTPTPRLPGPPPPYHQTQRTPNPSSTNAIGASPTPPSPNPNSSLSLPSPRMSSGLSSPADATPRSYSSSSNPRLPHPSPGSLHNTPMNSPNPRPLNPSNPGTPASVGAPLQSPGLQRKQSQDGNTPTSGAGPSSVGGTCGSVMQTPSVPEFSPLSQHGPGPSTPVSIPPVVSSQPQPEGMFGRTLQSYAQSSQQRQQQQHSAQTSPKEPNLMPVPSPQQIQYLNTFDGQELTIQKQPNTSLQEPVLISPDGIPTSSSKDGGPSMARSISNEALMQHQGPRLPGANQSYVGMQGDGFPRSASQSPIEHLQRFPTPGSQASHVAGGNTGEMPGRFPMASTPTMMGIPTSAQSPLEAMAQRFNSPVGMDNMMRFSGPGAGPRPSGIIPQNSPAGGMESVQQQPQRFPSPRQTSNQSAMEGMGTGRFHSGGAESPTIRFPGNGQLMGPNGPGRPGSVASPSFSPGHGQLHLNAKQGIGGNAGGPGFPRMSPGKVCPEMGPGGGVGCGGFNMNQGQLSPMNSNMAPTSVQLHGGQRLSHFDPITSMAQMSQSLAAGNGMPPNHHPHQQQQQQQQHHHHHHHHHHPGGPGCSPNVMGSMTTMNMASMQVSGSAGGGPVGPGGNPPSVVNFQTSMQAMQGVQQQSMMGQQGPGQVPMGPGQGGMHHQDMMNQVGQNMGPQTVNNTYVNATMSIQQLNIQNVTTSAYNPALQVQSMNPHQAMMNQNQIPPGGPGQGPGMGTNTVSSSVTMNPIVHSSVSPKCAMAMTTVSSPQGQSQPRVAGPQQFHPTPLNSQQQQRHMGPGTTGSSGPNQGHGPGMSIRGPGPGSNLGANMPYNGANVQVKASAPNTIQYLPARPQNTASAPPRPPSLEFLQRFTGPLSNMDNKGLGHNLQYFPHSGQSQGQGMGASMGMGMNMSGMGPQMNPQMNPSAIGPGMNSQMGGNGGGNMGMMAVGMGPGGGPNSQSSCMPRGPNPSMMRQGGAQQMMGGQMYGMFPQGPQDPSMYGNMPGPMMGGPGGPGMGPMGQGGPAGGGVGPMGSTMQGAPSGGPGQMYGGGVAKGQMPQLGMGVDTTQPLPPSMAQSAGFKQSPFMGPTTADPNYAQQFHNFQQQLYATNTRGGQINAQDRMGPGQAFFGAK